jgi:hypothetical protein
MLVNWTNEEGARFSPPMMGSGAAMGLFTEAEVLAKQDPEGKAFGAELARIGWQGEADPAALQDIEAYFELHIEQGALLERAGLDVGVVTHALAQTWYEVTVEGEEAHGGSPMAGRRDAMMAAAPLIAAVEEIALAAVERPGEPGRGTVGRLTVYPDSRNICPGPHLVQHRHAPRRPGAAGADGGGDPRACDRHRRRARRAHRGRGFLARAADALRRPRWSGACAMRRSASASRTWTCRRASATTPSMSRAACRRR